MSSIRVNWQSAAVAVGEYASYRQEISSTIASVRSVRSYRCMTGPSFSSLYKLLDRIVSRLEDEKSDMRSLENGLSDVLKTYKQYEQKAAQQISGKTLQEENVETSSGESADSGWEFPWGEFWKYISKGGIIGSAISAIGLVGTGPWSVQIGISSLKNILNAIGGISSTVAKGADANWKEALFGLSDGLSGLDTSSASKTFTSSLAKQFGKDLSFTQATKIGDKIKVGTKWGGYLLSLVSNGFENYEEFADQEGSGSRMVAETVIETATDIGVGALATAGVSAAAAALVSAGVIAGAPAIAIGAGAVAVTWAANSVCEWVTGGKDIGEVAADLVCDTAEAIGDGIGAVVDWGKSLFGF